MKRIRTIVVLCLLASSAGLSAEMVAVQAASGRDAESLAYGQKFVDALVTIDPYGLSAAAERFRGYYGERSSEFTILLLETRSDPGFQTLVLKIMVEIGADDALHLGKER